MSGRTQKPENLIRGADTVARRFGAAFRLASTCLGAQDIAKLLRTPTGNVPRGRLG